MRRFVPLAVLMLAAWSEVPAQQAAPPARELSLAAALGLAEEASETIGIARAAVQRARGEHAQARSGYLPQLTGSAAYTRTLASQFSGLSSAGGPAAGPPAPTSCPAFRPDPGLPLDERVDSLESAVDCLATVDPFGAFRDLPFGQENEYRAGLAFSQTVFDRPLMGRIRAASAGRDRAQVDLDAERAGMVVSVAAAYFDAVLADRLLEIADSTLVQAERTLREVELGREVGTQPEFDLLRARVNRDNQRPAVIRRRTDRDLAFLRLRQLLDLPLDQPLALTTPLDGAPLGELAGLLPADPDTAVAARAPVRSAEHGLRAAEAGRAAARGERYPTLRIASTYARIGFPATTFGLGDTDWLNDWTVSLRMEVPLFTGGRLSGERMVAEANLAESRLRLEQVREEAARETRNLLAELEAARQSWDASRGVTDQAARAYAIAEVRYREGISTQTELAESRLQLQQAQANRAQAARDLQLARVRVALLENLPLGR